MKINKNVREVMNKIGRRWDIIEKLYESPHGLTELARELGKKDSQVLRELKDLPPEIVKRVGKGRKTKYVLTENAKRLVGSILQAFSELPESKVLTDPKPDEWKRIKGGLGGKYEEERQLALEEFIEFCRTKRAWKIPEVLDYLKEVRNKEFSIGGGEIRAVNLIRDVIKNARLEKELEEVRKAFLPVAREMWEGKDWRTAFEILKDLLPEEEVVELAKNKCLEAFRREEGKEILNYFKSFFKKRLDEIKPWFYELVRDEDERVRKGALNYYRELIKPEHVI